MRYRALCPSCQAEKIIDIATHTTGSGPVCGTCRIPLRLSTEAMRNTPEANVWLVPQPQQPSDIWVPAIEQVPGGLTSHQQAAFEALMRRAWAAEPRFVGNPEP